MILSSSRILYQISADGLLPKYLRNYNADRDVAKNGVLISAVISVMMLFSGNIYAIAAISNFGLLFSYLMASFALMHFRRQGKKGSFATSSRNLCAPLIHLRINERSLSARDRHDYWASYDLLFFEGI
jgi:amino acid transporter